MYTYVYANYIRCWAVDGTTRKVPGGGRGELRIDWDVRKPLLAVGARLPWTGKTAKSTETWSAS